MRTATPVCMATKFPSEINPPNLHDYTRFGRYLGADVHEEVENRCAVVKMFENQKLTLQVSLPRRAPSSLEVFVQRGEPLFALFPAIFAVCLILPHAVRDPRGVRFPDEVEHRCSPRRHGLLKCSNLLPADLVPSRLHLRASRLLRRASCRHVFQDCREISRRIPCISATSGPRGRAARVVLRRHWCKSFTAVFDLGHEFPPSLLSFTMRTVVRLRLPHGHREQEPAVPLVFQGSSPPMEPKSPSPRATVSTEIPAVRGCKCLVVVVRQLALCTQLRILVAVAVSSPTARRSRRPKPPPQASGRGRRRALGRLEAPELRSIMLLLYGSAPAMPGHKLVRNRHGSFLTERFGRRGNGGR
jgi:hypothetical protein